MRAAIIISYTVLATFFFGLYTIGGSLITRAGNFSHRVARVWAHSILLVSGVRVDVRGLANVDPARPCIYMSNHLSNFDIPVLLAYLPVQFRWLAKAELFRIPVFGPAMRGAGYISIDRSDRRSAFESLRRAADTIRNGASVLIFPEGTRSSDGEIAPFKKGGFVLAVDSGALVVPITIRGTFGIMPKGSFQIRPDRVRIVVHPPIDASDYTRKTKDGLMRAVDRAMRSAA